MKKALTREAWIETNDAVCALLRQAHDVLALSSLPPKREWVGLTDEAIDELWREATLKPALTSEFVRAFARAIEAKLKEKNT
jgi:hypothetical protein